MWLDEQDAKQLLASYGIESPPGGLAGSAEEAGRLAARLGTEVYVKALVPASGRAGLGGVLRAESPADAELAFSAVTAALGATHARIEAACDVEAEYYAALAVLPGEPGPVILVSAAGGTGIEDRLHAAARTPVDPLLGLRPFHLRAALSDASIPVSLRPQLAQALSACYQAMLAYDALLIELNPVAVTGGRLVALDARLVVDDYAVASHRALAATRASAREAASVPGQMRELGIDYVDLGGQIGIVGLGAGLTMHLADWIQGSGGSAGYFFDATVAAVRDHAAMFERRPPEGFARSVAAGLRLARPGVNVLLANFTSGGTPVDSLTAGLLTALAEVDWTGQVVLHAAGNRQDEARRMPLPDQVTRAWSLGEAVKAAVATAEARLWGSSSTGTPRSASRASPERAGSRTPGR
jgi:succinyl-CoA synthetase beta subunit